MQLKHASSKMELKIIREKHNLLFKRKEILAEIDSEITPKIIEVEKILSEKFSKPTENIKTKRVKGKFGSKTFEINANIYDTLEDKEKTEIKTRKQRAAEKKIKEERIKSEKEAKKEEVLEKTKAEENKSEEVTE